MGFLMQGTEPDKLGASAGAVPDPVVPLQEIQQRDALFELFEIAHGADRSPRLKLRNPGASSQARMVGAPQKSRASKAQRPEHLQKREQRWPGQAQAITNELLPAGQLLADDLYGGP